MLSLLAAQGVVAQPRYSLTGHVSDELTGAPVIGVVVRPIPKSGEREVRSVVSDVDGNYTIQLGRGSYDVEFTHLSYSTLTQFVDVTQPTELSVAMSSDGVKIDEVIVSGSSPIERVAAVQIGVERVEINNMLKAPSLFGQRDIIRSLTLLPGVKAESDASSGFQVRGGSASQNLVLLDNMPIFSAGHMLGIFSIFNDDVLSYASLYKGLMGAEFSGGSSSVLDVGTKSGSMESFSLSANIGILSSSLYLETPLWRDRISFSFGARRSYLDMFLYLSEDYKGNRLYFYDINSKVAAKISERDNLTLSYFRGEDNLGLKEMMSMGWQNQGLSLQWFHRYSDALSHSTSLIWSDYDSENFFDMLNLDYAMGGAIRNYGVKHNFDWHPLDSHSFKFGFQSSYVDVVSADWHTSQSDLGESFTALDSGLWISDQWRATDRLTLQAGLRVSLFTPLRYNIFDSTNGDEHSAYTSSDALSSSHLTFEPRLTMNFRYSERQSFKGGYSRTTQNIHAMRNNTMSMPFDRFTMSSKNIKPQIADQFSLGYIVLSPSHLYELNAEVYYKHIENVYDYMDGKDFSSDVAIENIIMGGEGRSYGLEVTLKRNAGPLTGWLGYTLSWSETRIDGINSGLWYTSGNDRRHDISLVGLYDLTMRWDLSASWVYSTGQALTAPSAKYIIGGETFYYYAERNGYRTPSYHRLDVSATRTVQHKYCEGELSLGLYNLYNRQNPFMVSFENDPTSSSGSRAVQTSLFGIIPSISYGIKF